MQRPWTEHLVWDPTFGLLHFRVLRFAAQAYGRGVFLLAVARQQAAATLSATATATGRIIRRAACGAARHAVLPPQVRVGGPHPTSHHPNPTSACMGLACRNAHAYSQRPALLHKLWRTRCGERRKAGATPTLRFLAQTSTMMSSPAGKCRRPFPAAVPLRPCCCFCLHRSQVGCRCLTISFTAVSLSPSVISPRAGQQAAQD